MSDQTTVVFLGTPDFSRPFLEALSKDERFKILAVITQEDKPQGRKKTLTPPPVKSLALSLNLPVFQPPRLNKDQGLIDHLKGLHPDFLLVIAYGQILSSQVLSIPTTRAINVHGSILPLYRGASPIQQALKNGDRQTGLSIMAMAKEMDAGAVYKTLPLEIAPDDTDQTLRQKLSSLGATNLPDILLDIKANHLTAEEQNHSKATFCQKIDKEDGMISPETMTAQQIYNLWRAFTPWPGLTVTINGKRVKLLQIKPVDLPQTFPKGSFHVERDNLYLGCLEGTLAIEKIQLEGKNPQDTATFLSGNRHLFID